VNSLYTMSFAVVAVLTLLSTDAAEAYGNLGKSKAIINDKRKFVHRLRACNAYASSTPLQIVHHRAHKDKEADEILTKAGVLGYKSCRDFAIHLEPKDSIEFTQNGSHVGSFAVASLPQRDALFLLILHRRGATKNPAFHSHIFNENAKSAQLAVLDLYDGTDVHKIEIQDSQKAKGGPSKTQRSEDLNYDTVVSITPGEYECKLRGGPDKVAALQALHGESYVAMRVGLKGEDGFPEEVVVFPNSSGAVGMLQGTAVSLVMLMFVWQLELIQI